MHAIEVPENGGPEVLSYVEKSQPSPGPGEVLIKSEAIGVNFIDTYFRSGSYPRELPFVLGTEVAGTVAAVGDGVTDAGSRRPGGDRRGVRGLRRIRHRASAFGCACAISCRFGRGRFGAVEGHDGALPDQVGVPGEDRATWCWCTPGPAGWG